MENIKALCCDPITGVCVLTNTIEQKSSENFAEKSSLKSIKIVYFTDPICSACWVMEPVLRRLKLEYGHMIEIHYHMGGLLPSWDGFEYRGIKKPSELTPYWNELSGCTQVPINGDLWMNDPLHSSYPPSIAFKAVQIQSNRLAISFLRTLREMVFLRNINIAKWENILAAATYTGLDIERFIKDYNGNAKLMFRADLMLARSLGVTAFPSLVLYGNDMAGVSNTKTNLIGYRPYTVLVNKLKEVYPQLEAQKFSSKLSDILKVYPSLTGKELSILQNISIGEARMALADAENERLLQSIQTKNGKLWFCGELLSI